MITAHLSYFRRAGKWYSDATLEVDGELPLYAIWAQIDKLRQQQKLPGLVEGHSEYLVLVNIPDHRHAHPTLLGLRDIT